jgi:uncharacterized membrane protein
MNFGEKNVARYYQMNFHMLMLFIVFFIVANPMTFKIVRSILGSWVASADGLPTTAGLLLHALVYILVVHFAYRLVMGRKMSTFSDVPGDIDEANA